MVRGIGVPMTVERSPLPPLVAAAATFGLSEPEIPQAAALMALVWLHLTRVVAHVLELDIRRTATSLAIRFRGQRARVYTNQEPAIIAVEGACPLPGDGQ
jgi:hypothetical protein